MEKIIIRSVASLITLFFIVTTIFGLTAYNFLEEKVGEQLILYGSAGLFFLAILLEFLPSYVSAHIGILNAALYNINPLTTVLGLLSGSIMGSLLGFEVGRVYGKDFVKDLIGEKTFKKTEKEINKRGKWIVLIAAISPIPYIPMVIGSLNMARKKFILWGIFPRSIGYILAVIIVYFVL
jgi:uncharacterized membrane protein YdjX (TVP38/TMEM64 family)